MRADQEERIYASEEYDRVFKVPHLVEALGFGLGTFENAELVDPKDLRLSLHDLYGEEVADAVMRLLSLVTGETGNVAGEKCGLLRLNSEADNRALVELRGELGHTMDAMVEAKKALVGGPRRPDEVILELSKVLGTKEMGHMALQRFMSIFPGYVVTLPDGRIGLTPSASRFPVR